MRFTGWCQTLEVPAEVLRNNILQKASYFGLLGRLKGKNREIISQKQITPNILYSTAMGWAKRRAFVIKFPWVLLSKDKFQILYWTRAWTLFFLYCWAWTLIAICKGNRQWKVFHRD